MTSQQTQISQSIELYFIYIVLAFFVLIVSIFISGILAYRLDKVAKSISILIFDHNMSFYVQLRHKIMDRLDRRYAEDMDFPIEQPFKGKNRNIRQIYRPVRWILGYLGVVMVVCLVIYGEFYFGMCMKLTTELQMTPAVLSNDAKRLSNAIEAGIWSNRYSLNQTMDLIPSYQLSPSPIFSVKHVLSNINEAAKVLLDKVLNGFEITPSHTDFLYSTTNFTSALFKQGYRTGIKALLNEIKYCFDKNAEDCEEINRKIYKTTVELAENCQYIASYYKLDSRENASAIEWELTLLLVGLCVFIVVQFVCFQRFVNWKLYSKGRDLALVAASLVQFTTSAGQSSVLASKKALL